MDADQVIMLIGFVLGNLQRATVEEFEAAAATPGLSPGNRQAAALVAEFRRRVRDELEGDDATP